MILNSDDLGGMERRYRAAFVNSLSGFKAANLVGTRDPDGNCNLAIMSSAVHLGSHPPLLALVMRPDDAGQHTLANILDSGVYSLNHVGEAFFKAAHQTAARYPRGTSEFSEVGLTPLYKLAINGTNLVIGEIVMVNLPEDSIDADGSVDIAAAGTITVSGLDSYHRVQALGRQPYAKPGEGG